MRLNRISVLSVFVAPLAGLLPAPAAAQDAADVTVIYEREVFTYPRSGRPDPFRSLLRDGDLGIRIEDLMLRGVVHHEDPTQSVAILSVNGTDRRIQARVGERVGALRILAVYPEQVDVVIEELGVARRETLRIERPDSRGGR